jgi:hypothetical protein
MRRFVILLSLLLLFVFPSEGFRPDPGRSLKQLIQNSLQRVELSCSIPDFTTRSVVVDDVRYDYLHLPGYGTMQEPGQPALPVTTELIAIPFHAAARLGWTSSSWREESGYRIHPSLQPATDHIGDPEPEFGVDSALYATDAFFPQQVAEVVDTLLIRGMLVLVVQIRPVQFNPVSGVIRVHQDIRLHVDFDGPGATFEPLGNTSSAFYTAWLSNMLLNGSLLPEGVQNLSATAAPSYLIVTIDPFRSAADSIALWRQQMGFRTEVISQPAWTFQQVKSAVHQRYHNYIPRPDYLLILGDHDHVPAELIPVDNTHFGTDLYLVCMDGSTDHFPDMAKGRISVANASQALMVAQKIINYERNPVSDSLFYQRALHCAQFQDDDTSGYATRRFTHTSEEIRDYIMTKGYDIDRVYHTYSFVNPTNYNNTIYSNGEPLPPDLLRANGFLWNGDQNMIAQAINQGRFYVLHRDHGGVSGWGHPTFTTTSLNMLSNGARLPVVFSLNCQTGNFLYAECFSEKFLRLPNGGAAGVFSASYISYSGYNDAIAVGAFDAIWNDPGLLPLFGTGGVVNPPVTPHPPVLPMGQVLNHMMLRMVQTWNGSTTANRRQYRMFHYFGDPAMRMWTTSPQTITAQVPDTVVANTAHLPVTGCYPEGAVVTLMYRDTLRAIGHVVNGEVTLTFTPLYDTAWDAVVTINANNYCPWIKRVVVGGQAPALHNHPCQALQIPVKRYCDPISSGFSGADASAVASPSCAVLPGPDVWFSFVAPFSGKVEVEVGEGIQQTGVAVYSGSCHAPVHISCTATGNSHGRVILPLQGLTPGDTLLIRVWQNGIASPLLFTVCVREPDTFPVAELPYYIGFENGIDPFWELVSDHANGRIRIDTVCDARSGIASLLMDVSTAGTFVKNEARLRVNLRNKSDVILKFWWREYGDETHVEDGVFFSDDGGETFVKVIELQGAFEGWTQYLVDIDRLAGMHGLMLTEAFVIKFQQYDNWMYFCNTPLSGDGFAFDEIFVYVDTTASLYATIPYFTDFENGLDQYWSLHSTHPLGRIVVTEAYPPGYDGYFLMMDVSTSDNYNLNSADLRVNIPSFQNLILRFFWKSFLNEPHIENGIWLSDDGGSNFVHIVPLLDSNQYWAEKNYNLAALAQAHNLTPGPQMVLRLVQYDNWSVRSDGFGFDNLLMYQAVEPIIDLSPIAMAIAADTGTTPLQQFLILNQGTLPFQVDSVSFPEGFVSLFSGPQQILPGDTLSCSFLFVPDSVKSYTGYLYVHHTALRGLDSLRLAGEGMYRELVPDVAALLFDTLAWFNRDTIEFNLTNVGTGVIATTAVNVPAGFTVLTPQSQNFAVGQSRPVRVRFNPPAPGGYAGQLSISSNANQIVIPIAGYAADPLSVSEKSTQSPFVVMPNPFNSYLHITFHEAGTWNLVLIDMTGRIIHRQETFGNCTLEMDQYAAGVYMLELTPDGKEQVYRMKLVKE